MTLEELETEFAEYPFPRFMLDKCDSALMLFCAGFYGGHDCLHVYNAGIKKVIGVDRDQVKINEMRELYPQWMFLVGDAFLYVNPTDFDIVVADPQISDIEKAHQHLNGWAALANKYLVVTSHVSQHIRIPPKFRHLGQLHRNDDIAWSLFCRK